MLLQRIWNAGFCLPSDDIEHLQDVAAEPVYENGELIDGGSDLSLRGSLPYYAVEIIYSLALLQLLTIFSDKFWWLLLGVSLRCGLCVHAELRVTSTICCCSYLYGVSGCYGSMCCSHTFSHLRLR